MQPKHGGCFLCGSMTDEILQAFGFAAGGAAGVALCKKCYDQPEPQLIRKLKALDAARTAAMQAAREGLADG